MDFPFRIVLASVAASVAATLLVPQYSLGYFLSALVLFLFGLASWAVWAIVIYPLFLSPLRHLPQPHTPSWFMGQSKRVLAEAGGVPMRDWTETVPNDGLIYYRHWFNQERVMPVSIAALSEVLVTKNYDFIKPLSFRTGLGRILGIGILLAEGDEHKTQRKNLMPAFAYRHIKDLYPGFWAKAREMVQKVSRASQSPESTRQEPANIKDDPIIHSPGVVEVGDWTSRATLDIIGLSGMGEDFDSLEHPENKLNQTYRGIFNPKRSTFNPFKRSMLSELIPFFLPLWMIKWIPSQRNADINTANMYIKQVCRDMIGKKRVALEKGKSEVDILSVALESGGFSTEDLVNQMMTFLVAGHETTATSMTWAILELCRNPEVQHKLREEVKSKLPSLDRDITAAEVDNCHYLNAVCLEIFRLWPPVTITRRHAARDTSIQGHFIPKGTTIILEPFGINRSTQFWGPDSLEFKPERWLDADGKINRSGGADSNFAFLTFLHGPRSCIGQKFAQAEFACLLAAWVGRFETEFEDPERMKGDLEIVGGVTAKPKRGVWVKVKETGGW